MNLPRMPWIDLVLLQARTCRHLVGLLGGCIERKLVLNLDPA